MQWQVEKDADKYLSERKGTRGTEAGNKRKAGARMIKDIAGSVREKYASELKELRIKDEVAKLDEIKSRSNYYRRFNSLFSGMGDYSSQEAQEKFVTDFVGGISYKFADVEVARGNLTADKVEKHMGRISSDFYKDHTLMNWAKELSKNSEKRDELRGSTVGEIYAKYQSMRSKALKQSEPRNAAPERKAQMQKKAPAPKAPGM